MNSSLYTLKKFVDSGKMSVETACQYSRESYEKSALSIPGVQALIEAGRMTVQQAMGISRVDYEKSALALPAVKELVGSGKMTAQEAFKISKECYEQSIYCLRGTEGSDKGEKIIALIDSGKMTAQLACTLPRVDYEKSALSLPEVQKFILDVKHMGLGMDAKLASELPIEDYQKSQLSKEHVRAAMVRQETNTYAVEDLIKHIPGREKLSQNTGISTNIAKEDNLPSAKDIKKTEMKMPFLAGATAREKITPSVVPPCQNDESTSTLKR